MVFVGFGAELVDFYDGLAADNSREYWQAHREIYDRAVRRPLEDLAEQLRPRFGVLKIFRPHRDLRFSPDKRPYQEHASLATPGAEASQGGLYLQVSADGLLLAGGWWRPAAADLGRWRRLQDDPATVASLDRLLADLARHGCPLGPGDPVATAPRGWSRDHPRIELIRRRSLTVSRSVPVGPQLWSAECEGVVREGWEQCARWNAWLDTRLRP